MLQKIVLRIRTVRYLKLIQVFYQVWYRIIPKKKIGSFLPSSPELVVHPLHFSALPLKKSFSIEHNTFRFLNISHSFHNEIDWNYQANGKLWNYNLQYFDYLHQTDISIAEKINLLYDFYHALENKKVSLEPYPVSLRAMNVIRFLSDNTSVISTHPALCRFVFAELSCLHKTYEYHLLGNHLLENAFAMYMGGAFFDQPEWRKKSARILRCQLNEQILSDGGHFELSPMYHQIILFRLLELYTWITNVPVKEKTSFIDMIKDKCSAMIGWLQAVTFRNGDIPYFNDATFGIAYRTEFLNSLAKSVGIACGKRPLADSGYRAYTFGNYECVVDVGRIGPTYQAGHAHADTFSFIMNVNNAYFLSEAGTSTYEGNERRKYERSTSAHNTVVYNKCNQSEVWGTFRTGRRAITKILSEEEKSIAAIHDGYVPKWGVMHKRSFVFGEDCIRINDEITGRQQKEATAFFHFHPDRKVSIKDGTVVADNGVKFFFTGQTDIRLRTYEFANGFNQYLSAEKIEVSFSGELQTEIHFQN